MLITVGRGMAPVAVPLYSPLLVKKSLTTYLDTQSSTLTFSSGSGDGGVIASVSDLSGNGNTLVDAGFANKFIYKATGLHGKPAWRMNGSRAALQTFNTLYDSTVTVIVFMSTLPTSKPEGAGAGTPFSLVSSSAIMISTLPNELKWTTNQAGSLEAMSGGFDLTDMTMIAMRCFDTATAKVNVNDTDTFTFDPSNTYDDNGYFRIGTSAPTQDSDISEWYAVLVYDGVLSDVEMRNLYLWGRNRFSRSFSLSQLGTVPAAGQSLQDRLFTTNSGAADAQFETTALAYFDQVSHIDAAVSASFLTKTAADAATSSDYWWDDTASTPGPLVTSQLLSIADVSRVRVLKWQQGHAERLYVPGTLTEAAYKTALQEFFAYVRLIFPYLEKIILIPYHRGTSGTDANIQAIRRAQWETIDELDYVERGPSTYDLDLADAVHLSDAGAITQADREAERIAAILGRRSETGTLGPYVSAISASGTTVTATVTQDGGTSLTLPAGLASNPALMFRFEDSGGNKTLSGLSVDGNTLTFTLGSAYSGTGGKLYVGYGMMSSLSSVGAEVIKDDNGLPLRTGEVGG